MTRPELAVPSDVFVLSLPPSQGPEAAAREFIDLQPSLAPHEPALVHLLRAASTAAHDVGDVAAFLMYGDEEGVLIGAAAVLSLELVDPMSGSPAGRARRIADVLRGIAREVGHPDGTAEIAARTTAGRIPAVRVRFLSSLPPEAHEAAAIDDDGISCDVALVEVCRWLYPVPRHPDLVWSLYFQTLDLDRADRLIAEFDAMAASLRWARG